MVMSKPSTLRHRDDRGAAGVGVADVGVERVLDLALGDLRALAVEQVEPPQVPLV
jgi:hypothetical protein